MGRYGHEEKTENKKEKERDTYHGVASSDWYWSTAVKKEELKNGKQGRIWNNRSWQFLRPHKKH